MVFANKVCVTVLTSMNVAKWCFYKANMENNTGNDVTFETI